MICQNLKIHELAKHWYAETCLIIDTEATGGKDSELIDLAIVEFPTGKVLYESFVYTDKEMNYFAQQVHGIESHQLINAPSFSQVCEEVFPIIQNKNIFAYNTSYDKRIFLGFAAKLELEIPDANWHCLMQMYKQYKNAKKVCSLTQACEELNVQSGTHRAKSDALAAARVLYRMYQQY